MKKFLALLLALVMAFSLVACGGDKTPADDQQGDNNGDSQYPEYFAGMDQLIADAQAEGELTVYGSCEEEYLTAACQHFEELFGIKVNAQRLSTGEVQAKIEEENGNPSADVWFGRHHRSVQRLRCRRSAGALCGHQRLPPDRRHVQGC